MPAILYIMLMIATPGVDAEAVALISVEEIANMAQCEKRAVVYNQDAKVYQTADGKYLYTQAICECKV